MPRGERNGGRNHVSQLGFDIQNTTEKEGEHEALEGKRSRREK
jgi:hypothetical protein